METEKKLNILMTTMQMGFGGAETHIYELSRALAARGHTVTVASAGGKYAEMLENCGIRHIELPLNSKNPASVLRSYRGLYKLIRAEHFDIVHAHARIPAFVCGLLQKRLHFRFVTTAHWVFALTPLWKRLANWGDRQMAVSEDIKQYLIDNYGQFPDNIFVTVNGIDTDTFSPDADCSAVKEEFALSNSKHRIVSVSRMDESRGKAQLCLARCAKKLLKKYPDLEIVIVGDGVISAEKNLLSDVRNIARELKEKYGREIIFTPGLRTDTQAFMSCGDIFIGASRAALEAMSVGKPVIIAGNEGYIGIFNESRREIAYKTNYCCRGLDETDETKIYTDVCTLFDSADLEKYGAYCRSVILEDFSAARTAQDYENMYSTLPKCDDGAPCDILISGYYGFGNAGDDSIAKALIQNIRAEAPDANITILCKKPKSSSKKYGANAVGRFNIFGILRVMRRAKVLVSGGGNLLQNTTSSRSLFYYIAIIRLAVMHKMKIYVYANGVGPVFGKKHERAVVKALSLADRITFREPQSIDYVASLGFDREKIILSADPALTLSAAPETRVDYIMRGVGEGCYFAVSLRSFSSLRSEEVEGTDEETFANRIADEIDKIAVRTNSLPIYLIMQSSRDRALCERVNAAAKTSGYVLTGLTASEIMGVLSRCSLVIAMRLHLLIYGAAAGKPLLGISYDRKVDSMLSYMGYEPPMRVSDLERGHLSERAVSLFGKDISCKRIETLKQLAFADAAEAAKMAKRS